MKIFEYNPKLKYMLQIRNPNNSQAVVISLYRLVNHIYNLQEYDHRQKLFFML